MANAAAEAKLRFLRASAHLYTATAPATSAQLMLQRHIEIAGNPKHRSDDVSKPSCMACGTVLIPEWTSHTSSVEKRGPKPSYPKTGSAKRTRGQYSPKFDKYIRTKCLACHRFEDTLLQKSKASCEGERPKATVQTTSPADAMPSLDLNSSPLDKSTQARKRRQKARKHKSGLQAMLEKSRIPAASSAGFGLDLLDLMKHG